MIFLVLLSICQLSVLNLDQQFIGFPHIPHNLFFFESLQFMILFCDVFDFSGGDQMGIFQNCGAWIQRSQCLLSDDTDTGAHTSRPLCCFSDIRILHVLYILVTSCR